ncbi:MAG: hypothetical protein U0414_26665 [Polyangiaceae bacterium]
MSTGPPPVPLLLELEADELDATELVAVLEAEVDALVDEAMPPDPPDPLAAVVDAASEDDASPELAVVDP